MVKRHSKGEYLNEYLAIKTLKGTTYTCILRGKFIVAMMQGSCIVLIELEKHEPIHYSEFFMTRYQNSMHRNAIRFYTSLCCLALC